MNRREIFDIFVAILLITIILTYNRFDLFLIYLITVLISFLPHEFAHRYLARKLGYIAVFQLWPQGILMSFLTLLATFGAVKFIALGAVVVYPITFKGGILVGKRVSVRDNALISMAGPLINIFICIVSIILFLPSKLNFFLYLSQVNAWLSVFNLMPLFPLDGSKIFVYDFKKWFLMFAFSFLLLFFSTYIR
ncbi:MAG: peptidase M50 [Candidatus Aenigmarchaeota archaeon]|nr:peptidase M50 [Candidatus Aenigmarchaeota archaeon]MDW8149784.1 peptidase M50 [Candidatus Aenigmarchaeota archaeon]